MAEQCHQKGNRVSAISPSIIELARWTLWVGLTLIFGLALNYSRPALADDGRWGHLKGRFIYDGPLPKPRYHEIDRDTAAFGEKVLDESLIVNQRTKGIANLLIFLLPERGKELQVHKSYGKTAAAKVSLKMHRGRFDPHVVLLRTTQTMVQTNKDMVSHNANISFIANLPIGPSLPVGNPVESRFSTEERLPLPIRCNIHPWMRGYLLLRANPYMAKTDSDGGFEIRNLPVGQHTFRIWHERVGYVRTLDIGDLTTDNRGRLTVTVSPETLQLDDAKIPAKMFSDIDSKRD